jgi:hypothetical protein
MTTRRDILRGLGMGAAAAATGVGLQRKAAAAQAQADARRHDRGAAPWWLLFPLQAGAPVGKGWRLTALSPIEQGAAVATLDHRDGRSVEVHLCARRGSALGPAASRHFDLVVMDGRSGDGPTDEDLGRVVQGLARRVRHNERRNDADLGAMARVLPQDERELRYGGARLG